MSYYARKAKNFRWKRMIIGNYCRDKTKGPEGSSVKTSKHRLGAL
jgi:hypothetical protein